MLEQRQHVGFRGVKLQRIPSTTGGEREGDNYPLRLSLFQSLEVVQAVGNKSPNGIGTDLQGHIASCVRWSLKIRALQTPCRLRTTAQRECGAASG
jgi:hypothetical protein